MADLNKSILIGRLTADPELRHTAGSQIPVTSFSIAINRRFTKQGEKPIADFINIIAWRTTAEFVTKYFKKGQSILIVGSIQTRSYEDKEGKKRQAFDVVADEVQFAEPKKSGDDINFGTTANSFDEDFTEVDIDDALPF